MATSRSSPECGSAAISRANRTGLSLPFLFIVGARDREPGNEASYPFITLTRRGIEEKAYTPVICYS